MKVAFALCVAAICFFLQVSVVSAAPTQGVNLIDPTKQYTVHSLPVVIEDPVQEQFHFRDSVPSNKQFSAPVSTSFYDGVIHVERFDGPGTLASQNRVDLSSLTYQHQAVKTSFLSKIRHGLSSFFNAVLPDLHSTNSPSNSGSSSQFSLNFGFADWFSSIAQSITQSIQHTFSTLTALPHLVSTFLKNVGQSFLHALNAIPRLFDRLGATINQLATELRNQAYLLYTRLPSSIKLTIFVLSVVTIISIPFMIDAFKKTDTYFILKTIVSLADLIMHTSSTIAAAVQKNLYRQSFATSYDANRLWIKQHLRRDIGNVRDDLKQVGKAAAVVVIAVVIVGAIYYVGIPIIAKAVGTTTLVAQRIPPSLQIHAQTSLQKSANDCTMPGQCDDLLGAGLTIGSNFLVGTSPKTGTTVIKEESKAVARVLSNAVKSPLADEEIEIISKKIANGHAFKKHVVSETDPLAIIEKVSTKTDFQALITTTLKNPDEIKFGANNRIALWNERFKTVVIYNPADKDLGTTFKPPDGVNYLKDFK